MKLIIIFIISLFITGCEEKIYEDNSNENIFLLNEKVEVYNDIYINEILDTKDNIKIISSNYKINTEKIGIKTYDIIYEADNKKYKKSIDVNVVDTQAPIVFSDTNKTIYTNYKGDLCNIITYGDNYDGKLNCVIEGNYDLTKKGIYKLNYIISDSSKNIKEVKVTLNVIKKKNSNNGNNTSTKKRTLFPDVLAKYKNDSNEIGIDVSKWQGNIDFKKVKEAGATFVMMRIGVQKTAKGKLEIDPYYEQNIKNAKEAGLKVGVYLYSIATSKEEAINHANWVLNTLKNEKLDLPIVFDWENWSSWNTYQISFYDINSIADSFMTTIKNNGYESMLYGSKFYLEKIWQNKQEFQVWLAHYTEKTSYKGKYKMWQICNNGKIDGINGDVDINIMYK